jgi:hypothetical protein
MIRPEAHDAYKLARKCRAIPLLLPSSAIAPDEVRG